MNRKRPPALTSPWKIGFFVSLLLVTASIGVGFLITRTFDISWSWIKFAGGTWVFDQDSFIGEMLPLVVLVPLLSLFSYFLITGAVRKYKAYLDSGLDYRHLVQSIQTIDDLRDGDKIKTLGNYPELRDFLLKTRDRISEREAGLEEKENALAAQGKRFVVGEELKADIAVLVEALNKGPQEGLKKDLPLSIPDIKLIDEAIRRFFAQSPATRFTSTPADATELMDNLLREFQEASGEIEQKLTSIGREFAVTTEGAREIEEQLGKMREVVAAGSDSASQNNAGTVKDALAELDEVSAALEALGEETKGMAINTALQAGSGHSGTTELVKLADNVRDVAAKFNGIARRYSEVGFQIKNNVQAGLEAGGAGDNAQASKTVNSLINRFSLWVEQVVVLSSKVQSLHERYLESAAALEVKFGGQYGTDEYHAVQDLSTQENFSKSAKGVAGDKTADDFERQVQVAPLLDTEDAAPEKAERVFDKAAQDSEDGLFADIPRQETVDLTDGPETEMAEVPVETPKHDDEAAAQEKMFEEIDGTPDQDGDSLSSAAPRSRPGEFVQSHMNLSEVGEESAPVSAPEPAEGSPGMDKGKVTAASEGMSLELESHRFERPRPAHEVGPATSYAESTGAAGEEQEEVIDLYELGAVDYQPDSVHQNT